MTNELRHPSFVVVGLSRRSIGGRGATLFGSDLVHHETIALHIQEAHRDESCVPPRIAPCNRQLIEVEMSEIQFAELITTFNRGEGVPGTLRFLHGVGDVERPPTPRTMDSVQASFDEAIVEVTDRLDTMTKIIHETKMSEKARTTLLREIDVIRTRHKSSIPFLVEQFTRHVRKVAASAKAEVEAYVSNRMLGVSGRGREELQAPVRLELPEGKP